MIIEQELREQIQHALSGSLSLNELYAWLMDRSWNMHLDSDQSAVELAADVEALFFERSDGLINDAVLRERLLSLLNDIQLVIKIGYSVIAKQSGALAHSHDATVKLQAGPTIEKVGFRSHAPRPLVAQVSFP